MSINPWHRLVKEQSRSGENVRRFCLNRGISEQSLRYWKKKLEASQSSTSSPRLVPVVVQEASDSSERLEIRLGELSVLLPLQTPGVLLQEIIRNLRAL